MKKAATSIKTKLTVVIILIMAVPLIAAVVSSSLMSVKSNIEDVEEFNTAKSQIIEASVQTIIDQNMQSLQTFASAPSTIAYIAQKNSTNDGNYEDVSIPEETMLSQMRAIDDALADGNSTIISGNAGMQLLRFWGLRQSMC